MIMAAKKVLCKFPRTFTISRSFRRFSTAAAVDGSDVARLRSFAEMPTAGGNSFLGMGRRLIDDNIDQNAMFRELVAEHGKLFRMKTSPWNHVVFVADPEIGEVVAKNEGKYPTRGPVDAFLRDVIYEKPTDPESTSALSLASSHGKEWKDLRSKLHSISMPRKLSQHIEKLDPINETLLEMLQESVGPDGYSQDLSDFTPYWTIEGMARFVHPAPICVQRSRDSRVGRIVDGMKAFMNIVKYANLPIWLVKVLPIKDLRQGIAAFGKLHSAVDSIFEECASNKTESWTADVSTEEKDSWTFVEQWKDQGFSDSDIQGLTYDFIAGATDTTVNTVAYILHMLAKHPEVQAKAHQEVVSLVGKHGVITAEAVQKMSYIKAIQKETIRFGAPVVSVKSRVFEKDIALGGFHIPADTLITLSNPTMVMDANIFEDPEAFRPERWMKNEMENQHVDSQLRKAQLLATSIFGSGVRSCIGRRTAELLMWTATAKIAQKTKLELHPESWDMKGVGPIIMRPDRPIRFKFTPVD